jgi:hypothetical protein
MPNTKPTVTSPYISQSHLVSINPGPHKKEQASRAKAHSKSLHPSPPAEDPLVTAAWNFRAEHTDLSLAPSGMGIWFAPDGTGTLSMTVTIPEGLTWTKYKRAWRILQQGVFGHTCAVVDQTSEDPDGGDDLQEIALVSEAEAGCPGARILRTWPA